MLLRAVARRVLLRVVARYQGGQVGRRRRRKDQASKERDAR